MTTAKEKPKAKRGIAIPKKWADSYTEKDQAQARTIVGWLNQREKSGGWLSTLSGVPTGSLGQLLGGIYPSSPTKQINKLVQAIRAWEVSQSTKNTVFVETSIYKKAKHLCNQARKRQNFQVFSGFVGIGKTKALKHYASQHPSNTVLIEADPHMLPKHFFEDLLDNLGVKRPGFKRSNINTLYRLALKKLEGTTYIILFDEAEKANPKCLEWCRRIRDKAGIGIVLSGTQDLYYAINANNGHFDQIRSRAGVIPEVIESLDADDLTLLAEAFMPNELLDEEIIQRLWFYSQGSARMLVENLIFNLHEYGLKKHSLSVQLIDEVAVKALSLDKWRSS